ncbi:DEAD/DEAH box helicase [Kitasatospora paranensis]|uniref:Helicase associated domain protein n=1 Tax=Kitasatospora paranensis TaxID=258053 RepID=A0ABW2G3Z1_9ACTN
MPHKPIRLRPHQQRAVGAITAGLQRHSRVTVVAACGTGKTVIARASADTYTPHGNILVLAPSQDLVAQTAREWDRGRPDEKHIAVCALPPSGRGALCIPFTTSPAEPARRVADHSGPTIVFSTYQSLPAIVEAHRRHGLPEWALAVADEAHHTTGSLDKSWGDIHDDAQIPAQRRLYMTATPRRWSHPKSRKPGAYKQPLASMDNPALFGPVVFRLELAEAIAQGILADYRVVVPVISAEDLHDILTTAETTPHLDGLRLAAMQVGLLRAIQDYRLSRVLTFHRLIAAARTFARTLPRTATAFTQGGQPMQLWAAAVDSRQPRSERNTKLWRFAGSSWQSRTALLPGQSHTHILSSVRCLGEGVDMPEADAVLFADPKRSVVDIIQTLGRALRQPPGSGKIATLIIPVYIRPGQTTREAMESSDFRDLWAILDGLRTADSKFYTRLRRGSGRRSEDPVLTEPERPDEIADVLSLRAHQFQGDGWNSGYEAAMRFYEEHGHLEVPTDHRDSAGVHLGSWIGEQRNRYAEGTLDPDQAFALYALRISWPHPPGSFEHNLALARDFATAHHTLAVHAGTPDVDAGLARWLDQMRAMTREDELPPERIEALNSTDPCWNPAWSIDWQYNCARLRRCLATGDWRLTYQVAAETNLSLGAWLDHQIEQNHILEPGQLAQLALLARQYPDLHPHALLLFRQTTGPAMSFARGLSAARRFLRREGHLQVPDGHVEVVGTDHVRLDIWIDQRRYDAAQLTSQQAAALDALGLPVVPRFLEPELPEVA